MDKWFRRIDTLLLLGALSFVLFFVMPAFFGIRPVRVLSGSMKPEIVEGDMVYIQSCREEDVQTGDVIAFENGNGQNPYEILRRYWLEIFPVIGISFGNKSFFFSSYDSV